MTPDDFRVRSNWDGDLSLMCPHPDCHDSLDIKHNGTSITKLRKMAKKHLERKHPDMYLVAATGTPPLEQQ